MSPIVRCVLYMLRCTWLKVLRRLVIMSLFYLDQLPKQQLADHLGARLPSVEAVLGNLGEHAIRQADGDRGAFTLRGHDDNDTAIGNNKQRR